MQNEPGAPLTAADAELPQPSPTSDRRIRGRVLYVAVLAATVLAADQLTKTWALGALTPGEPTDLVGSVIRLNLIRNPGAAFSIGENSTWILTVVSLAIVGWVVAVARRVTSMPWALALGFLLGGALGNLVDRFVRPPAPGRGHVVDFIDYAGLFIGNVADIAIVGAAVVIAVLAYRGASLVDGATDVDAVDD
jgi:signal peptidase II